MTNTYSRIYDIVRQIPQGKIATYGQVAKLAGMPLRARQVGYALHALKDESIPWHRVVNARGEISSRSRPIFKDIQRELLEQEGIGFSVEGKISLKQYLWNP